MKGNENCQGGAGAQKADKLTPRQERAILALLEHTTMKKAAAAANVSETTLWRWLQESEFQSAYTKARRETVKHAIARLQQNAAAAVDTLREVMTKETAPDFARVSAAKAILDYSLKAVELEDLADRIAMLESKVGGK